MDTEESVELRPPEAGKDTQGQVLGLGQALAELEFLRWEYAQGLRGDRGSVATLDVLGERLLTLLRLVRGT